MKKALNKLFSMNVALLTLGLLIIACIGGSIISQEAAEAYYTSTYSPAVAHLILDLGLNDVFHTPWFIALAAFLCLNLLGCNILRFKAIYSRTRSFKAENFKTGDKLCETEDKELFKKLGFRNVVSGDTYLYAVRNRIGVWGAWLTHLGILLIIVGFALGQYGAKKYTVYAVPGQSKAVEGTDLIVRIDSFKMTLRDDETVEQYESDFTLFDTNSQKEESGHTSVNHPATLMGMKVYQNSTGWAANIKIYENDKLLQDEILCAGEAIEVINKPELYIVFRAFYPDYAEINGQAYTLSSSLNNPAYLYMVYYKNQVIGMNALVDDYISIDDYIVTFENPTQYSLLQLKSDRSAFVVGLGGLILVVALIINFYLRTEELYLLKEEEHYAVYGRSFKGGVLFEEKVREACGNEEL